MIPLLINDMLHRLKNKKKINLKKIHVNSLKFLICRVDQLPREKSWLQILYINTTYKAKNINTEQLIAPKSGQTFFDGMCTLLDVEFSLVHNVDYHETLS